MGKAPNCVSRGQEAPALGAVSCPWMKSVPLALSI